MAHGRMREIVLAAGVAFAAAWCDAARAADVELAPRYIDPQNGFSLCPPAGAERRVEVAVRRIVRWSMRDAKMGAIAWTLAVRKEPAPAAGVGVKQHAEKLQAALAAQKETRVEAVQCGQVLGKDAIFVRTEQGEKARRWQSEVWVLASATHFLAVSINGPLSGREHLEAVLREVTATLRLTDPEAMAAARKENLARGGELLKGLTDKKLESASAPEPQWYLYRRAGKDIGFLHVAAEMVRRGLARGVEVRTVARLELKGGQVMYVRRAMFATADRSKEEWSETVQIRQEGKVVKTMAEEGSTQGGVIVCEVSSEGKSNARRKPVPEATAPYYLPRAMGPLLPRLVDLAKPAAYAFADYTTAADDFDMRTFAVMQPETITLGARTIEAVRASDQVAADAEAAALHVAPDGTLLRMRTAEGISMEQAERTAVLRRFEDAEAAVKAR